MADPKKLQLVLAEARDRFVEIAKEENLPLSFTKECGFATQSLNANSMLMNTAQANPQSLKNALVNVASIGLSLNPALGQAYLVPRNKAVCLDIGYRGMIAHATKTGAVTSITAGLVYKNDVFEKWEDENGPHFKHSEPPFGDDRGEIVGAYCRAMLPGGGSHVFTMSVAEIETRRAQSQQGKSDKGPWHTHYDQMALKTVIRAASKFWPSRATTDEPLFPTATFSEPDDEPVREPINITPEPDAPAELYVTAEQAQQIYNECAEAGLDETTLCTAFKVGCVEELPAGSFETVLARIADYFARKQSLDL